ncbi:MAG: NAD(P)/FAD-dependent oxidoreductase [Muribaculaceae bacterium]|nr:NAD(P)/FAD-dependent oxidoreductase [Muribaculaceae bacterium]
MDSRERIVVIGAGFGGLNFAKYIDKRKFRVILLDRNNYHGFPPLFYQVASSGLEPGSITFALRREMRSRRVKGCEYHVGEVCRIDVGRRLVYTQFETIPYDRVVLAAGTANNFFGIAGLENKVYTMKSVGQAIRLRNRVIERMERAALCDDPHVRRRMLTFVVIGGGPTGVEIAGALGEMKRYIVPKEYPELDPAEISVKLVEGSDRLLRTMSRRSSDDAFRQLGELMVDITLGKTMKDYNNGTILFADGTELESDTIIWTAGVTAESVEIEGATPEYGPGRRIMVDEFNRVKGMESFYAIGDICCCVSERFPRGCPQLAQPAIQQGRCLAKNLNRGLFHRPFEYRDKGSMATIGRNKAVADIRNVHFSGYPAWLAWMAVHLISLLGMRNKLVVLLNWIWNYWTYSAALRVLMRPARLPLPECLPDSAKSSEI